MLKRLAIKGFRSIKEMDLEFASLNVFIGAKGAGKSNLFSFFKMLHEMTGHRLQPYITAAGGAGHRETRIGEEADKGNQVAESNNRRPQRSGMKSHAN